MRTLGGKAPILHASAEKTIKSLTYTDNRKKEIVRPDDISRICVSAVKIPLLSQVSRAPTVVWRKPNLQNRVGESEAFVEILSP
jgi:hypothetical protein